MTEGELGRQLQRNLEKYPLSPREAARIVCEVHAPHESPIVGVIPDFTKLDGDLYREAWRVLRRYGGLVEWGST